MGGGGALRAGGLDRSSAAWRQAGRSTLLPKLLLKDGTKGGSSLKLTGLPVTGEDEGGVVNMLRGLKGLAGT